VRLGHLSTETPLEASGKVLEQNRDTMERGSARKGGEE
jgi:hypothetical protein